VTVGMTGRKGSNSCGSSYVSLSSLSESRDIAEIFSNLFSPSKNTIGDRKYFYRPGATRSCFSGSSYVAKRVN
jgi:hypothetical protein